MWVNIIGINSLHLVRECILSIQKIHLILMENCLIQLSRQEVLLDGYADVTELTRELCLDIIEYITVDRYSGDKDTPRSIHIYYKFIDKKPIKGE